MPARTSACGLIPGAWLALCVVAPPLACAVDAALGAASALAGSASEVRKPSEAQTQARTVMLLQFRRRLLGGQTTTFAREFARGRTEFVTC
jgi:hypothetical protein